MQCKGILSVIRIRAGMYSWCKKQGKDMQSTLAQPADGVPGLSLVRGATVFAPAPCGVRDLLLSSAGVVQLGPDKLGPAEALVSPANVIDAAGCIAVPGFPILSPGRAGSAALQRHSPHGRH